MARSPHISFPITLLSAGLSFTAVTTACDARPFPAMRLCVEPFLVSEGLVSLTHPPPRRQMSGSLKFATHSANLDLRLPGNGIKVAMYSMYCMYRRMAKDVFKTCILPSNSHALNWIAVSACEINCLGTIFP